MSTKFLISLVLAQTALLVLLFVKLGSFEDRLDILTQAKGPAQDSPSAPLLPSAVEQVSERAGLDSQTVRRIVREELLAARSLYESPDQNSSAVPEDPVVDEAEMQYRQDLLTQELEFLKQQDEVSQGELDNLIGEIVRLDPERRSEMLGMLNRAMNRGEIKGNL